MSKTDELIEYIGATDLRGSLPTNPNGTQFKKRDPSGIKGIVYHQELGWGTLEQVAKYHTGPNHMSTDGLSNISYTIGIRRNGEVCVLNDLETKTWSQGDKHRVGDENAEFMSVLFEGLFSFDNTTEHLGQAVGQPTPEQMVRAITLWTQLADFFKFGVQDLYGHYHFGKPACPGNTLKAIIDGIRNQYLLETQDGVEHFLEDYDFASVKEFQTAAGIVVDGDFGRGSRKAAYRWIQEHPIA